MEEALQATSRTARYGLAGRWRAVVPVVCLAVVATTGRHPARGHDPAPAEQLDAVIQHGCHEVFAGPTVPWEAADALVPEGFVVGRNEAGQASLLVTVRTCKSLRVGGEEVFGAIDSYVSIGIVPPGENSAPGAPAPHASFLQPVERDDSSSDHGLASLDVYIVQWVSNNKQHARWLRQATGLGDKVRLVPDLRYDYDPVPESIPGAVDPTFAFAAPWPAPSPFHIEAAVTEPGPARWDVGLNLWAKTDDGILIIFGEHHRGPDQLFGSADGTITAEDPASPLGAMFGDQPTRDINNEVTTAFTSGAFTDGQWTKCVRTATHPCSSDDH